VDLVDDRCGRAQLVGDDAGQFEDHVHPRRAQVDQQVTGSADSGVRAAADLLEGVQVRRARPVGEQPVPQVRTDADDAQQFRLRGPEPHRAGQAGHIAEDVTNGVGGCVRAVHHVDEEHCGVRGVGHHLLTGHG